MSSQLEICNAALMRLGADTITALTDDSKKARLCNAHYDRIKKDLIISHFWNFAIKRTDLVLDHTDPAFEYSNQFDLPSDYLRVFKLYPEDIEYKIEGNKLLCNEDAAQMIYVADVAESFFRVYFEQALILKLAVELSYTIIQSNQTSMRLIAEYEEALRNAKLFDAQEGTPDEFEADLWLNVRK